MSPTVTETAPLTPMMETIGKGARHCAFLPAERCRRSGKPPVVWCGASCQARYERAVVSRSVPWSKRRDRGPRPTAHRLFSTGRRIEGHPQAFPRRLSGLIAYPQSSVSVHGVPLARAVTEKTVNPPTLYDATPMVNFFDTPDEPSIRRMSFSVQLPWAPEGPGMRDRRLRRSAVRSCFPEFDVDALVGDDVSP